MHDHIHLTVATLCERDNKFLIVEETCKQTNKVVFNQPAGHVELNETIFNAAIRETQEETAWLVQPKHLIGIYQNTVNNPEKERLYCRVCLSCDVIEQQATAIDPDITAVHWMSAEQILTLSNPRSSMVKRCLQDYLSGKRFPLDILTALS